MKTSCDVTISNSKTYWKILWWIPIRSNPFRTEITRPKVAFTHSGIWRNVCETTQLFPSIFLGLIFGEIDKITGRAPFVTLENGTGNLDFRDFCHFQWKQKDFSCFLIAEFDARSCSIYRSTELTQKWKGCVKWKLNCSENNLSERNHRE